jgi:hypothetical protein
MKRKVFIILLFLTPILLFFWMRLMHLIFPSDRPESLKSEITGAITGGYFVFRRIYPNTIRLIRPISLKRLSLMRIKAHLLLG